MSEENKVIDDFTDEDKVVSEGNFWDYKTNKEIIGNFKRYEKDAYGEHVVLEVNQEEIALPNLTALNGKLRKAVEGDRVKVVSLGDQKSKQTGRIYFDFDVFIKKKV
ncbi:MAG TPA: hypothetical protein VMZ91_03365 [Candidatus Paceibacterota bacterium]|nr:hypothetical protein [Candidatus Paceibacterota bacterium]